uniref:U1 small ribonucleoprotein n=1 Tax=Antonospora locustae TaxID=278021 RepID=Q6E6F7_ANTLO|nr:U1 small ribonucleoprotein [Antonospora locustae]
MNNRPCRTLYFQNLNEKMNKSELARRLKMLVSRYAYVVDVTIWNTMRLRGQAFVTFKTTDDAAKIKSILDNFFFLGTSMKIHFAKKVSRRYKTKQELVFRPTKTLVIQKLGNNISSAVLEAVFKDEKGVIRIRHVPVKKIALIDFIDKNLCEACFRKYLEDGVCINGEKYVLETL